MSSQATTERPRHLSEATVSKEDREAYIDALLSRSTHHSVASLASYGWDVKPDFKEDEIALIADPNKRIEAQEEVLVRKKDAADRTINSIQNRLADKAFRNQFATRYDMRAVNDSNATVHAEVAKAILWPMYLRPETLAWGRRLIERRKELAEIERREAERISNQLPKMLRHARNQIRMDKRLDLIGAIEELIEARTIEAAKAVAILADGLGMSDEEVTRLTRDAEDRLASDS